MGVISFFKNLFGGKKQADDVCCEAETIDTCCKAEVNCEAKAEPTKEIEERFVEKSEKVAEKVTVTAKEIKSKAKKTEVKAEEVKTEEVKKKPRRRKPANKKPKTEE